MLYFLLHVNITQKATSIKHDSGYIHMDIRSRFIDLSQLIKAEMYKKFKKKERELKNSSCFVRTVLK